MARNARRAGEGRTRWGRFGIVVGVAGAAVLGLGTLAANGALAITFAFSGIPFNLTATQLSGTNFVQYAMFDKMGADGGAGAMNGTDPLNKAAGALIHATGQASITTINNTYNPGGGASTYASDTVTQLGSADITGLNQVVCAPTPLGRSIRVHLVGTGNTHAQDMVIQAPALFATTADFTQGITIGETVNDAINAAGVSDPYGAAGNAALGGSFAQGAPAVTLKGINQIGIGTEAGQFSIQGLQAWAEFVDAC